VTDGGTVTVLDAGKVQHKIRLTGIDAPEKAEPFGQRAKQNLSIWVFGKKVLVETDKLDRYGRTLGKVMVNGFDANLEQVKAGFAWHFKAYEREQPAQDRQVYLRAKGRALLGCVYGAMRFGYHPGTGSAAGASSRGTEAMDCGAFRR
jgi:endonuclease YncB( thermonuclease family)